MPNLLDQQPLVPPALRRFQTVKDQQAVQMKHSSAVLCSTSADCLVPNESHGIKSSPRRQPKSTVHGVVDQFGQLHEQKSGIDRLLTSVGNIFRRMTTQESRTFRLLDNSHSVDACPDENRLSPQGCWWHTKGDRNSVDKTDTGKEDLPVVMITTFTQTIPSQNIQNGARSKFRDGANSHPASISNSHPASISNSHPASISNSHEGSILKFPEGSISKCDEESISKSHEGAASKFSDRRTSKCRDRLKFHEGSTSKSPKDAVIKAHGHSLRRMRWPPVLSKNQVEIRRQEQKQSTSMVDQLDNSRENSDNTEAVGTWPKCNKQTQLSYSRHRKLNFSKLFRIKRNSGQKYLLVPQPVLETEHNQPQALLCDPELDHIDSLASKKATALESMRLPSLHFPNASNIANHGGNNMTHTPDRRNCQLKCVANKFGDLACSSAGDNFTIDMKERGPRVTTSRSKMTTPRETLHKSPSDLNVAKCEHLAESTDELTQLIWAAF